MGLFSTKNLDTFETLFIDQLEDLYDAEQRLAQALPLMAQTAHNPSLKSAFETHTQETHGHINRLERAFEMMGHKADRKTCYAMKGLIDEGEEVLGATGNDAVIDAALIAAAQRTEHYEISGYGTARSFAERLGRQDVAELLQQTLSEEEATDKKLTVLAEQWVNQQAAAATE
jgi:ferritin-like metal-binding protein YciE